MNTDTYVVRSLEQHLFFGRIMKEHALFIRAGMTPAGSAFAAKAEFYKNEFEKLLGFAVSLSQGIVSENALCSGEIVTEYTLNAERKTEKFTGIRINTGITERELNLNSCGANIPANIRCRVSSLNKAILKNLNGLICLKEEILKRVLNCQLFSSNYPLLIEHTIREAEMYRENIRAVENDISSVCSSECKDESFWDHIMMEHALFIRGSLDPSETELFKTADKFAEEYMLLLRNCGNVKNQNMTVDSLTETKKFKEFKTSGVDGIEKCQIRSVILPLLADHVLREANHYIRMLE